MPSAPKMLYLATAREGHAPDGTQITNFSGRFIIEHKEELQKIAIEPELIFCDEQMDLPYLFALYALKEKELTGICAPFMAAVSDFFCYIENHWEDLCQDIEEGVLRPDDRTSSFLLNRLGAELHPDAERARELRRIFQVGLDRPIAAEIWPSLRYVQAIGAGGFSSYTGIVRRFIGDIPIHMSVYAASEGLFGVSVQMNSPEYVMIPESGYYEFIPEEDADLSETLLRTHTLEMDQLQPGKKYEMVVTNLSGFYRYRIGDVVTVNGYFGQSPVICFSYRRHQILKKLGPLKLILLQPQTFALYRDVQIWNGASPNQLKLIHVITNAKTEAFFRGLES